MSSKSAGHVMRNALGKKRGYGADKVRRQLNREKQAVECCTGERLMQRRGIQGTERGKTVLATVPGITPPCPLGRY